MEEEVIRYVENVPSLMDLEWFLYLLAENDGRCPYRDSWGCNFYGTSRKCQAYGCPMIRYFLRKK